MTTAVCDLYGESMAACAHDDGVREARQVREGGKPGPNKQQLENKSRKRERRAEAVGGRPRIPRDLESRSTT
eukprot:scaffold40848_cov56-Phaeocystis_antarctica.AAC.2